MTGRCSHFPCLFMSQLCPRLDLWVSQPISVFWLAKAHIWLFVPLSIDCQGWSVQSDLRLMLYLGDPKSTYGFPITGLWLAVAYAGLVSVILGMHSGALDCGFFFRIVCHSIGPSFAISWSFVCQFSWSASAVPSWKPSSWMSALHRALLTELTSNLCLELFRWVLNWSHKHAD